jgi:hypothetical protein
VIGALGATGAVLNTGHLFSPIVLAWTEPEMRRVALRNWHLSIVLPLAGAVGAFTFPYGDVWLCYLVWNSYHYAMQHHGFWALTRWRAKTPTQRLDMRTGWLGVTLAGFTLPILIVPVTLFHWLGDIGLSGWTSPRRWLFIGLLVPLALTGIWLDSRGMKNAFPWLARAHFILDFAHFSYSAMVWPAALMLRRGTPIIAAT